MNNVEKKGCMSILKKLSHQDLLSLNDTVTKKQVVAESVQEAIKLIMLYSQTAVEFLRRKRIRRDVLFQYLHENDVIVPVSAEKAQLISKCLEFWGSDVNQNSLQLELDEEETPPHLLSNSKANVQQTLGNSSQPAATVTSASTNDGLNGQQTSEVSASSQSLENVQQPASTVASTNGDQQQLGETFASWFYRILNSHNPAMGQTAEDFGPHHFWSDVTLQLICVTPQPSSDSYSGSVLVSERLLALVGEEQLLFNPNVGVSGVSVRSDQHGLTYVLVCGTLHRQNECLGVYQQVFGLVRDPRFENNWKIKTTKLRIQSGQVTAVPRLQDGDNSELLALALGDASSDAVVLL